MAPSLNAAGLKWTHPNRQKILSYFANHEEKLSSLQVRKTWPAAAAEYGPAAGLLVFLVGAALLALLGLGTEVGVVETQEIGAAASGRPRGGRTVAARLVAAGPFLAERRGGAAAASERRVRPRGGRSHGSLFCGLVLPDLVAALDEVLRPLERPRVNQVPDVARQLAEEEDSLDLLHFGRLQNGEVVPHDGGPVLPHIG